MSTCRRPPLRESSLDIWHCVVLRGWHGLPNVPTQSFEGSPRPLADEQGRRPWCRDLQLFKGFSRLLRPATTCTVRRTCMCSSRARARLSWRCVQLSCKVPPHRWLFCQSVTWTADAVEPLVAEGLEFVAMDRYTYDRLFLKEVIHHFAGHQLGVLFQGVYRQLNRGGRIVIMTRPHNSSHYPFFSKAHEAWSAAQLRESVYVEALKSAGFSASVRLEDYMVSMPTVRWFQMIRSRFWSNLAGFTQEEIEEGLREVSQARDLGETLQFPDKLVFVVGEKHLT